YRDELGREPEAYRCYREAFANDPSFLDAAQALRAMAAMRGEWGLVSELLYREIESVDDLGEKATLHVELALIFEERLHDVDAAIRNHESALSLDPNETVSPPALARLYAAAQRFPEAAHAEETAAAIELIPNDRAARLLRAGEHMERAGWTDDAVRLYGQAAGVPGGGDATATARAKAVRLGGEARRPEEIRAELESRLAGDPDADERLAALRQLLRLAVEAGDDDVALARTGEILVRDPGDAAAFLERRRLLSARGDWAGVVDLYRSRADTVEDPTERANLSF